MIRYFSFCTSLPKAIDFPLILRALPGYLRLSFVFAGFLRLRQGGQQAAIIESFGSSR